MSDKILFMIFPYVACILAIVVSVYRYKCDKFKFSSLSSQFLEGNQLFWGSVLWHYGILTIILGHFLAFLFPKELLLFNAVPIRLFLLEITGLGLGIMSFFGIMGLFFRRFFHKRIRVVSTKSDYIVLAVLMIQVITGIIIGGFYRWGSSWFASSMVPYLKSLFLLAPNIDYVVTMPFIVKLHIVNAFVIVTMIPFTRFLHFLVVPFQYIGRPWQIVRWNWDPKKSRKV